MTHDDIIRIAREAGFLGYESRAEEVHNFATLVAAAERKRLCNAAECCSMCKQKGCSHETAASNAINLG
jgi:hypothetical protein